MKTTKICPICGIKFTRIHSQCDTPIYCSRSCANKAPGRMTEVVRNKISRAFSGSNNPIFKGEWITTVHGKGRTYVWLNPEVRIELGLKKPYTLRSRIVWMQSHPNDPLRKGEHIHHLNGDTMDDRPENLVKLSSSRHAKSHNSFAEINAKRKRERRPDHPCEICGKPVRWFRRFCSVACTAKGLSGAGNANPKGVPRSEADKVKIREGQARARNR